MARTVHRWWAGVAVTMSAIALSFAQTARAQCGDWEATAEPPVAGPHVFEWDTDGEGPNPALLVASSTAADNASISLWDGTAWAQLRRPEDRSLRALCVYRDCLLTHNSFTRRLELIHADGSRTLFASDVLGFLDFAVAEGEDLWLGAPPNGLSVASHQVGSNGLLHYTGTAWTPVPGAITSGRASRIVAWNGGLVAAGSFDTIDGVPVGRVAFFDGSQWQSLSWSDTRQPRIARAGADLIAAGQQVYRWNGGSWEVMGPGSAPNWSWAFDGYSPDVASTANGVIAYSPNSFSTWVFDGSGWSLLPSWHRGIASAWTTWRGAPVGLFADFTYSVGLVACAYEEGAWWHPLGNRVALVPSAVGTWGGRLVVGGIVAAGGTDVGGVAAFDGEHWDTLGGGLPLYLRGDEVNALVEHDGVLWVGGTVWIPFGPGTAYMSTGLWRWDGQTWQQGPGGWSAITRFVVHSGQLYAVGVRTGTLGTQVARMDGGAWTTIGAADVQHMVSAGSMLYVAGNFTSIAGVPASGIAAWDGEHWAAVPPPQYLTALGTYQGALVAGSYEGFSVLGASGWQNVDAPYGYGYLPTSFAEYRGDLIIGDVSLYRWNPVSGARPLSTDEPKIRDRTAHMTVLNGSLYITGVLSIDSLTVPIPLLRWTDMPTCDCDTIDFNRDGVSPDPADIEDFVNTFMGTPRPRWPWGDIDFNNDGLFPDTLDIEALLSVFSGGPCVQ